MADDLVPRETPQAAAPQAPAAQAPKAKAPVAQEAPRAAKKWMTRKDDPTLGPEWENADPTQIDQGHTEE